MQEIRKVFDSFFKRFILFISVDISYNYCSIKNFDFKNVQIFRTSEVWRVLRELELLHLEQLLCFPRALQTSHVHP